MNKINELSIADLKATYDFIQVDLEFLRDKATEERITANELPAYLEVKEIENKVYNRLLNLTRGLI